MTPREIRVSIGSSLAEVALVGQAVNRVAASCGLRDVERYHTELCVVEAVTNIIEHGYRGEPGHEVFVTITVVPGRLELRIRDRGAPIPEPLRPPDLLDPDPRNLESLAERGRGLYLIHRLMDAVEYRVGEEGNELLLVKNLPPGAGPS